MVGYFLSGRRIVFFIGVWGAFLLSMYELSAIPATITRAVVRAARPVWFEVVIPSYNNAAWYKRNLDSIISQHYQYFHVTYIDDCSSDGTADLVAAYITERNLENKVTLVRNTERKLKLYNMYHAIHAIPDDRVIVEVDGDDWLSHVHVLQRVGEQYANSDVWLTYGHFVHHPDNVLSNYYAVPHQIIAHNAFRRYKWTTSHLKTYYAWLFKRIAMTDLMHEGQFFRSTADQAYMFPMLEMAGFHSRYIPEVLYVYNVENQLNDNKVDPDLQNQCETLIRQGRVYGSLTADQIPDFMKR